MYFPPFFPSLTKQSKMGQLAATSSAVFTAPLPAPGRRGTRFFTQKPKNFILNKQFETRQLAATSSLLRRPRSTFPVVAALRGIAAPWRGAGRGPCGRRRAAPPRGGARTCRGRGGGGDADGGGGGKALPMPHMNLRLKPNTLYNATFGHEASLFVHPQ